MMRYLIAAILALSAWAAPKKREFKDLVWQLTSSKKERQAHAQQQLIRHDLETVKHVREHGNSYPSRQRGALVPVLKAIAKPGSQYTLAEFAVLDMNKGVRQSASEALVGVPLKDQTTDFIISRAVRLDTAAGQNALSAIKTIGNDAFVGRMINRIDGDAVTVSKNLVTFDINFTSRRLVGYDTYPIKSVLQTADGPLVIEDNIKMPRFQTFKVRSRVTVASVTRVLTKLTGKKFKKPAQWKEWWAQRAAGE